jgi:hypothetical protein
MAYFSIVSRHVCEVLKRNSRCLGRDLNQGSPECKAEVVTTPPQRLVARRIVRYKFSDVSEKYIVSIFRVED